MFVDTPRTRNSASARRARATAAAKSRPRHVSLTSIESKCAPISAPRWAAPSSRMPAPPGRPVAGDPAGVGTESVGRVLGGDPALHRRTACAASESWLSPRFIQRLPVGDPHLAGHQVDVGDLLGDGVLDLDARVHLDEHVVAALVEQELHGARVASSRSGARTPPRRRRSAPAARRKGLAQAPVR